MQVSLAPRPQPGLFLSQCPAGRKQGSAVLVPAGSCDSCASLLQQAAQSCSSSWKAAPSLCPVWKCGGNGAFHGRARVPWLPLPGTGGGHCSTLMPSETQLGPWTQLTPRQDWLPSQRNKTGAGRGKRSAPWQAARGHAEVPEPWTAGLSCAVLPPGLPSPAAVAGEPSLPGMEPPSLPPASGLVGGSQCCMHIVIL